MISYISVYESYFNGTLNIVDEKRKQKQHPASSKWPGLIPQMEVTFSAPKWSPKWLNGPVHEVTTWRTSGCCLHTWPPLNLKKKKLAWLRPRLGEQFCSKKKIQAEFLHRFQLEDHEPSQITPRKLTCPLNMRGSLKTIFLLKWSLFRGHVNFGGRILLQKNVANHFGGVLETFGCLKFYSSAVFVATSWWNEPKRHLIYIYVCIFIYIYIRIHMYTPEVHMDTPNSPVCKEIVFYKPAFWISILNFQCVYVHMCILTHRSLLTLNDHFRCMFLPEKASLVFNVGQFWTGSGTREVSRGRARGSGRKREKSREWNSERFTVGEFTWLISPFSSWVC